MNKRALTFPSALADWWHRQRENRNVLATLRLLSAYAWEFLRDSLPDRRRQRYGDIDYDWEYRVDTTSATLSWRTRLLGVLNSPYQPIPPEEFHGIMQTLCIDFSRFTFIDVGSGKGRALLLAADYGFRKIIGVELLPELHKTACGNIEKSGKSNIELICCDAAEFVFPSEPTVVFLFNPLPESVLRRVVKNIEQCVRKKAGPFYIAYANPVYNDVITGCPLLTKIGATHKYSIFRGVQVSEPSE